MFNTIKNLYLDAKNIQNKDPAATNVFTVIFLYPRISCNFKS